MKVAVTDACIFIDLLESEACTAFFQLPLKIVTTKQVWGELERSQKEIFQPWIDLDDLSIVEVRGNIETLRTTDKFSNRLSIADLSVWAICHREKRILLTSDRTLRKSAEENDIKTHGLLWVFDQIVKNNLLSVSKATEKLKGVFNQNSHYESDTKLLDAFERLQKFSLTKNYKRRPW